MLPEKAPLRNDTAIYILLAILMGYVLFASPIQRYMNSTALQIQNNELYEATILKRDADNQVISVQPYDPENLPQTKYAGESIDPNAHLIPYVISKDTLQGEHISEFKQRQILKQQQQLSDPTGDKLQPVQEGY